MTVWFKPVKNGSTVGKGKYYAIPQSTGTMDIEALAKHMSEHNSPYSKGVIMGLLTDMVSCIREMVLTGQNVRLDNLAIFSVGIKNKKGGAETAEEVARVNCEGAKLRARAIGDFTSAQLQYAVEFVRLPQSGATSTADDDDTDTDNTGGSGSQTSGGQTSGGGTSTDTGDNTDPTDTSTRSDGDDSGDGFQG